MRLSTMKKLKLFRFASALLIFQILSHSAFSFEESQGKINDAAGRVKVALVPIAKSPSDQLEHLVEDLSTRLEKTKGIEVQSREQTNAFIDYYKSHVGTTTKAISQDTSLTTAREMIRDVRYDEAERILNSFESSLHGAASVHPSGNDLTQVYLLKAKIFHSRGQEKEVQSQFEKVARVDPDYELDSKLYGNWALKGLKRAKEAVASQGTGSVTITSSPNASEVFINGFHRGITPVTVAGLPQGNHLLEIRTVNHKPVSREIQIKGGETLTVNETLARESVASKAPKFVCLNPQDYRTPEELSRMITTLGYYLGVDKVILVADEGGSTFAYRFGDAHLGAIQNQHQIESKGSAQDPAIASIIKAINAEAHTDILKNPGRYANQTVGSVALHEKRKSPLYKKPLFWVLVAASAGTGGALAAILGGGAAVAGAGGVLIGF